MTRVLLVGSGAREHAIATALTRDSGVELYAATSSRNPGITRLAKDVVITKITEPKLIADYAVRNRIELAVVGPEAPLVSGVVDELDTLGVRVVGPKQELAALEGDKAFCRELLNRHGISGNPAYRIFTDPDSAESYLRTVGAVAIKPAGLTGGKGVKVSGEHFTSKEEEIAYAREVLQKRIGVIQKIVVEEKLDGEEYSMQAFVDGRNVYAMPLVQDHKRAYEGDSGPNTGGMGSYSDHNHLLPFLSQADLELSARIMEDVVRALQKDTGEGYRGILYGGFMLAKRLGDQKPTPMLIEFNCRFGDPEAMNVVPIMSEQVDFTELCERIAEGSLKERHVAFERKATVCKYLVPAGYPERAEPGQVISVNEDAITGSGGRVFYASVDVKDGQVVTSTSRAVGVVGISDTIESAERVAEASTRFITGPLRHRRDIGTASLIQKRVDHVRSLVSDLPLKAPQVGIA